MLRCKVVSLTLLLHIPLRMAAAAQSLIAAKKEDRPAQVTDSLHNQIVCKLLVAREEHRRV